MPFPWRISKKRNWRDKLREPQPWVFDLKLEIRVVAALLRLASGSARLLDL
jgi:hypothetical protein